MDAISGTQSATLPAAQGRGLASITDGGMELVFESQLRQIRYPAESASVGSWRSSVQRVEGQRVEGQSRSESAEGARMGEQASKSARNNRKGRFFRQLLAARPGEGAWLSALSVRLGHCIHPEIVGALGARKGEWFQKRTDFVSPFHRSGPRWTSPSEFCFHWAGTRASADGEETKAHHSSVVALQRVRSASATRQGP